MGPISSKPPRTCRKPGSLARGCGRREHPRSGFPLTAPVASSARFPREQCLARLACVNGPTIDYVTNEHHDPPIRSLCRSGPFLPLLILHNACTKSNDKPDTKLNTKLEAVREAENGASFARRRIRNGLRSDLRRPALNAART